MGNKKEKQFIKIYEKEADIIFRFTLIRVSNREEAKDIVQESFSKPWQSMNQGEEIENPKAFLFAITRNKIIDWYRKKKNISIESLSEKEDDIFDVVDPKALDDIKNNNEASIVLDALKKLDKGNREIIYMRFVEDLLPSEIAKVLDMTPNAVSIRITRGLEELRKILNIENNFYI